MAELGASTISRKSHVVRQDLLNLISFMDEGSKNVSLSSSAATDALERFKLWAGNMGAMRGASSRVSLDSRLAEGGDIHDHICRQLDELVEAIEDLRKITQDVAPNRDMASEQDTALDGDVADNDLRDTSPLLDTPLDEAHMIIQVIAECISSLFRLGMLVRRSTPRDRFKRALQASDYSFPAMFDIDYVRHRYPKIRADWLTGRLGGGIAKRRQFIKYCRDHRKRLGYEDEDGSPDVGTGTERLSSKATTFLQAQIEEVEDDTMSFMSASTISESLTSLKLPQLADLSKDNEPFECPICFTLQNFQTEKSWRIHAFRDLKAYVCTIGEEECDAELFGDRDSWFEHELKEHRAYYKCSLCQHGPLKSKEMKKHIQAAHGPFPSDQLEMLQDTGRQAVARLRALDCPFCHEWGENLYRRANPRASLELLGEHTPDILVSASRFKRHVATHQEQLAIFALPRAAEEDGTPGSGSVAGSNSHDSSLVEPDAARKQEELDKISGTWESLSESPSGVGVSESGQKEDRLWASLIPSNHGQDRSPANPETEHSEYFELEDASPVPDEISRHLSLRRKDKAKVTSPSGEAGRSGGSPGNVMNLTGALPPEDQEADPPDSHGYEYTNPSELVSYDLLRSPSQEQSQTSKLREVVAPEKDDQTKSQIPPGARWTKVSRKKINPEALCMGKERFEVREDFVIVLRVLSKEEVEAYATATSQIRERRRKHYEESQLRVLDEELAAFPKQKELPRIEVGRSQQLRAQFNRRNSG